MARLRERAARGAVGGTSTSRMAGQQDQDEQKEKLLGGTYFPRTQRCRDMGEKKEPEEQERIGKTRKEFAWLDVFGICGFWDVCRNTIPCKMITYRLFFSEGLFTE